MVNPILISKNIRKILLSRTDNIGDVILTLPLAFYIKKYFPHIELYFLCKNYTKPILDCTNVFSKIWVYEDFINLDLLEIKKLNIDVVINVFPNKNLSFFFKKCKIPIRIGTSHRLFHLFSCNRKVNFTRKNSELHESQLNFMLLKPIIDCKIPSFNEINELINNQFKPNIDIFNKNDKLITNSIIIHPKSNASAVEYPIEKYIELAIKLAEKGEIIVFTGTEKEGAEFRNLLPLNSSILDLSGKFSLSEFIYFLSNQKCLIACSTGPYHIAGILGIKSIGLFSAQKPIHPGRWKALGKKSTFIQNDEMCPTCMKKERCYCIRNIEVDKIIFYLQKKLT